MTHAPQIPELIERLRVLEYAIRQSIPVRDDQEDPAEPEHLVEATACGITVGEGLSKGDLLSLVQTRMRASR